jgi:hypothetical protein
LIRLSGDPPQSPTAFPRRPSVRVAWTKASAQRASVPRA